ncbi:MAG: hypothetical protein AAFQ02_05820 [Bacteroidota bacterium]
MRKLACLLICITSYMVSCTDSDAIEETEIRSTPYFPLRIGSTIDYQITEVIYRNEGQQIDTIRSQLRESITGQALNEAGDTIHIIERLSRPNENASWSRLSNHRILINDNQALRTEGNQTFIKLRLPIETGEEWNANAFFDDRALIDIGGESIDYYKGWTSRYQNRQDQVKILNQSYSDIIEVELASTENRLELRQANELYAAGIGLIYRGVNVLDTQCFDDCADVPWEEKAEQGHIYRQEIIDYN